MTIESLFDSGIVIWGTYDDEAPEPAIAVSVDGGGCIVVQQEDRHITLNVDMSKKLRKVLLLIERESIASTETGQHG